jgi:putative transposase
MPRYPSEVRHQVVEPARSGAKVPQLSATFGMSEATIYNWFARSRSIGARSRVRAPTWRLIWPQRSAVSASLRSSLPSRARLTRCSLSSACPKRLYPVIASLPGQGNNVRHGCRFLGVTESGYYAWRRHPTSPRALRRLFLAADMNELGIKGPPKRRMPRSARVGRGGGPDLVRREFRREAPDELWMTDITQRNRGRSDDNENGSTPLRRVEADDGREWDSGRRCPRCVFVVAAHPERRLTALVATLWRAVEQSVVSHRGLEAA